MNAPDYCGCCGRQMSGNGKEAQMFDDMWCWDCAKHVAATGHLCDRTFSALNEGKECPYQVSSTPAAARRRG